MYPFRTASHDQLMDLAYRTFQAAYDHDPVCLEADILQLLLALNDHVLAERPDFLCLAPGDSRLLCRGQERIADLLLELGASAATGAETCDCRRMADSLVAELELQLADERRYLLAAAD